MRLVGKTALDRGYAQRQSRQAPHGLAGSSNDPEFGGRNAELLAESSGEASLMKLVISRPFGKLEVWSSYQGGSEEIRPIIGIRHALDHRCKHRLDRLTGAALREPNDRIWILEGGDDGPIPQLRNRQQQHFGARRAEAVEMMLVSGVEDHVSCGNPVPSTVAGLDIIAGQHNGRERLAVPMPGKHFSSMMPGPACERRWPAAC